MEKSNARNLFKTICITLVICALLLIAGFYTFNQVKIKTEARRALREAKNAALAIRLYDIKEYSLDECVFDTRRRNNISEGALKEVYDNLEHECYISLISYDRVERKVTNFIYSYNNYIVEYKYENGQDIWTVNYVKKVLEY